MRASTIVLTAAALIVAVGTTGAWAEGPLLPGKTGDYGRRYDVQTEETFTGTIHQVHVITQARNASGSLAVEVIRDADGRTEVVYLGPRSKWKKMALDLQPGRSLCLTGSRVEIEGRPLVIAKHVNDDQYWVGLRSDAGQHVLAKAIRLPEETEFVCAVAALAGRH